MAIPEDQADSIHRYGVLMNPSIQALFDAQDRMAEIVAGSIGEIPIMTAQSAFWSPLRQVMEDWQTEETLVAQMKVLGVAHELETAGRSWAESFDLIRRQIEEATRFVDKIRLTSQLAAEVASQQAITQQQLRLMGSAEAALHDHLATFEAANTAEQRRALLPSLLQKLIDWMDALPPDAMSLSSVREMVGFLFMVFGLVSSEILQDSIDDLHDEVGANQELVEEWHNEAAGYHERIEERLDEMNEEMEALAPSLEAILMFRTTRPLPVRVAPNGKARRLGTVPMDVLIEQIHQQGRWLRVVYRDLQSGMPVTGWVYNRGLVEVDVTEDAGL